MKEIAAGERHGARAVRYRDFDFSHLPPSSPPRRLITSAGSINVRIERIGLLHLQAAVATTPPRVRSIAHRRARRGGRRGESTVKMSDRRMIGR